MAHQGSFSSCHSSHSSTPTSGSAVSVVSGAASVPTASFSIFQEGVGQSLVCSPPRGTPELRLLVDAFIALDIPFSMKMEMIQHDFEAHTQRTGERYKTYFVPAAAPTTAAITSPAILTSTPSPIFQSVFEPAFQLNSAPAGGGSGTGSVYLELSPASRSSPSGSELTVASDSLFSISAPAFPATFQSDCQVEVAQTPGFLPAATASGYFPSNTAAAWPTTSASVAPATMATASSHSRPQQQQQRHQHHHPRRRLSGSSSMQILTRNGEDVTHVSSRAARSTEERENTRLVRQQGACAECRRKKTRCSPDHMRSTTSGRTDRTAPYVAPVQSGRAKETAAAARAAKASKEKRDGKKPEVVSEPVTFTSRRAAVTPITGESLGGIGGIGGIGGEGGESTSGWDMFNDSFDWAKISDQGRLFTDEELDLNISTTLAVAESSSAALAHASDFHEATTSESLEPHLPPRYPPAIHLRPFNDSLAGDSLHSQRTRSSISSTAQQDNQLGFASENTLSPSSPSSSVFSVSEVSGGSSSGGLAGVASGPRSVLVQQSPSSHSSSSMEELHVTGGRNGLETEAETGGELESESFGMHGGIHGRTHCVHPESVSGFAHQHLRRPRCQRCLAQAVATTGGSASDLSSADNTTDTGYTSVNGATTSSMTTTRKTLVTGLPQQEHGLGSEANPLDIASFCSVFSTVLSSLAPSLLAWAASHTTTESVSDNRRHKPMDKAVFGSCVACQ